MVTFDDYVSGLDSLRTRTVRTYYSYGSSERAHQLAAEAERGYSYLKNLFKTDADLLLLVLDSNDWSRRTTEMYGVPFENLGALHFSAETETPAIKVLSSAYAECQKELRRSLASIIGDKETAFNLALQRWFDHMVVHELTHGFAEKNRIDFGTNWLSELFADYTTYAFLNRFESECKEDLRTFEILSRILYEGCRSKAKHKSIDDFEHLYTCLEWPNYIWYHGKFFVGVFELYARYGDSFITDLVETFRTQDAVIAQRISKTCEGFDRWFGAWKHRDQ